MEMIGTWKLQGKQNVNILAYFDLNEFLRLVFAKEIIDYVKKL